MPADPGALRIIAGKWRRRRIVFDPSLHIRPTPERLRETLFSWLQPRLHDAVCWDFFAGSGALGFEALSRGAKQVTFFDNNPKIMQIIKENALLLECNSVDTVLATLPNAILSLKKSQVDLVFLDPPYGTGLLLPCFSLMIETGCLCKNTWVYFECEKSLDLSFLENDWQVLKLKATKSIQYGLVSLKHQL